MAKNITTGAAPGTGATIGYSNPAKDIRRALENAPEEDIFSINLNGNDVQARKGETIMEVCHREDVYVPHYCWHPALSIAGNCRLCLVEVEKVPKPVIGCQTQVTPGMVIRTNSEQAKTSQEWMMEFLLVNHPLDCPICDRGGECQLQRYSMDYGTSHTRMADKKRKFVKPQADPLIDIERNRCIMCTRCVRFCDEVGGEHVMGVFDRGEGNYIGTFGQGPVSNIYSGNVIDLCPVGCLTNKEFRFKARSWELKQTQSTCDQCSSGCKITSWTRNELLYRTTPPSRQRHGQFTINEDTEEFICNQGRFAADYSKHESRQDESLVRRADRLVQTSYDEAIRAAAQSLKAVGEKFGNDAVAIAASARLTNEEGLLAAKLARNVLKTDSIDWRFSYTSAEAADAVSLALEQADGDLEATPDVVVVVNGNLVHQSPIVALQIQELGRRMGKTIVMLGHHHDDYLSKHSENRYHNQPGFTAGVLNALASGDTAKLSELFNKTEDEVKSLLDLLKSAGRGLIVHTLEDFAGLYAPEEVPQAINLRVALGESWGYLPVVRDRNAVGLNALNVEPQDQGVSASNLISAIEDGRIKGLLMLGADSLASLPNQERVVSALKKLDTLIVADLFETQYSQLAQVVLATASNLERTGTYTDIEGNIALLKQAIEPMGDSQPVWKILTALGRELGAENFGGDSIDAIWTQTRKQLASASAVTLKDLELEGGSNAAHYQKIHDAGGARNRSVDYNPGNYRKDGLHIRAAATVSPVSAEAVSGRTEFSSGNGELVLTWGAHVSGRGYLNDRASIAQILLPKPFLEMNPRDAAALDVQNDQFAVIEGSGFRAKVGIRISNGPAPGCVYLPAGTYGEFDAAMNKGPVNVKLTPLTESAPDQGDALMAACGCKETH